MNVSRSSTHDNALFVTLDQEDVEHLTSVEELSTYVHKKVAELHPELLDDNVLPFELHYDIPERIGKRIAADLEISPDANPSTEVSLLGGFLQRRRFLKAAAAVFLGAPILAKQQTASAAECRYQGRCQYACYCDLSYGQWQPRSSCYATGWGRIVTEVTYKRNPSGGGCIACASGSYWQCA